MIELASNGGAMAVVRLALTTAVREIAYVNVVELNHKLLLFYIYHMLL